MFAADLSATASSKSFILPNKNTSSAFVILPSLLILNVPVFLKWFISAREVLSNPVKSLRSVLPALSNLVTNLFIVLCASIIPTLYAYLRDTFVIPSNPINLKNFSLLLFNKPKTEPSSAPVIANLLEPKGVVYA